MKVVSFEKRSDFEKTNSDLGFDYADVDGVPYWCEDHAYEVTSQEAETLWHATTELHQMCLETVDDLAHNESLLKSYYALNDEAIEMIQRSWEEDHWSCYGRFDFAFDGNTPKLLEYNADTPTSLLESSLAQWKWFMDHELCSQFVQFNELHEKLMSFWASYKDEKMKLGETLHFTYAQESLEDFRTCEYMADLAFQANILQVELMAISTIQSDGKEFFDASGKPIKHLFKLYPYEWLLKEDFSSIMTKLPCTFVEPAWKFLLSHKAFLAVLWEKYKTSPLLLPAYLTEQPGYVKKALLGREGWNVTLPGQEDAEGPYADEGFVWQEKADLGKINDRYFVVGSWVVGEEPAGICFREDSNPVINNTSLFVPHYVR